MSQKIASGKRLNEILFFEMIIRGGRRNLIPKWKQDMYENGLDADSLAEENLINVLTGVFYDVGVPGKRFKDCVFIEESDSLWNISRDFETALANKYFLRELEDLLFFARGRYLAQYKYPDRFAVGQKYTYEDVLRLLDWSKTEVSLNIGGYKYDERTKTYPVFVNYDKNEDISATTRYEDHFIDQSTLIAISKSNRTLTSKDMDIAVRSREMGVNMFLFVRKNKDDKESKEFYYLGRIFHKPGTMLREFVMPGTTCTAVEIEYSLETPVEKNLYDYITSGKV